MSKTRSDGLENGLFDSGSFVEEVGNKAPFMTPLRTGAAMTLVDELFDEMTYARNRLIEAMLEGEESEFLLNHLVEVFERRNTRCLAASSEEPDVDRYKEAINEMWYSLDVHRDMSYEEIVSALRSLADKSSVFRNIVTSLKADISDERTPIFENLIRRL